MTAPEKWTPARRRELTRTALVQAAATVFARRGFEGASLDEIAEAAGYTRGAIYKNFAGKEDLFFAVFDQVVESNLAAFAEESARIGDYDPHNPEDVAAAWALGSKRGTEWFALLYEFRLYALRNDHARARFLEHQRKGVDTMASFIEDYAGSHGVTPRLPFAKIAAIMNLASEGFEGALLLDPGAEELYASFLKLILPVMLADYDDAGE